MVKYMLLIYGDAQEWAAMTDDQRKAHDEAHQAFQAAAGSRILGGQELEWATMATSLRADSTGHIHTTDGPFLEAKEALGGFYLIEAADLDEVLALTKLLPELKVTHSGVEVRPVVDN